jgi:hypothetical protein
MERYLPMGRLAVERLLVLWEENNTWNGKYTIKSKTFLLTSKIYHLKILRSTVTLTG